MNKSYDPNKDYMKLMEEAAARGDYAQAALYEEKRNEKIRGEGLDQYAQTHSYEKYLPKTTAKQMEEVFAKLQSREPFSYDFRTDKLYEQYRDHYSKQGKLASEDAEGQAAALTGGYGNSYARTLAQQAYSQELDKLDSIVPELYDMAKEEYDAQGDALLDQYDRLAAQLEKEQEQQAAQEQRDYERQKAEEEKAYSLALKMLGSGLMPSQEILQSSGISQKDAQALYDANRPKTSSKGSSGSGSSGSSKTSGSDGGKALTNSLWDKLQKAYDAGKKAGDLGEFHRYRSSLKAQGYSVAGFDRWAKSSYGSSYDSGEEKIIDRQSVLALGYGPLSDQRLEELVKAGVIEKYVYGDYLRFRKKKGRTQSPVMEGYM